MVNKLSFLSVLVAGCLLLPLDAFGYKEAALRNLLGKRLTSLTRRAPAVRVPPSHYRKVLSTVPMVKNQKLKKAKKTWRNLPLAERLKMPQNVTYQSAVWVASRMTYFDVINFWKEHISPEDMDNPMLRYIFMPSSQGTATTIKNNKVTLFFSKKLWERMSWLRNRPGQGHNDLQSMYVMDKPLDELARRLSKEKMVFLGEIHYRDSIQKTVINLVRKIKEQTPNRRVVVFSEFLFLPKSSAGHQTTPATYYRRVQAQQIQAVSPLKLPRGIYAEEVFYRLSDMGVELYPLEDRVHQKLIEKDLPEEYETVLFTGERNKIWTRVMDAKMAEIRQTDPDALFIVYAGMGHTSWLMPYSLPRFFAQENPAVVEITLAHPSSYNLLSLVWGKEDPFFEDRSGTSLHFWKGKDARLLAQKVGFDYSLTVSARPDFMEYNP